MVCSWSLFVNVCAAEKQMCYGTLKFSSKLKKKITELQLVLVFVTDVFGPKAVLKIKIEFSGSGDSSQTISES